MTAFSVNDFIANINSYGTLKASTFNVLINIPVNDSNTPVNQTHILGTLSSYVISNNMELMVQSTPTGATLVGGEKQTSEVLAFRAEDVSIPGASLDVGSIHRYGIGPNQKFPHNVNFTDININFLETGTFSIWYFFNSWIRGIFGFGGAGTINGSVYGPAGPLSYRQESYDLVYKSQYTTNITIYIYNEQISDRAMGAITLLDAFPVSQNDIRLSWSDRNSLIKTSVLFNFRDYNIMTGTPAPFPGPKQPASPPTPPNNIAAPVAPPSNTPIAPTGTGNPILDLGRGQFLIGANGLPVGATT